jgi:thiamine pyrophosphate-dependent acetolactate synthase large subunit-like protein
MVLGEPYLSNRQETLMPLPWVKWAYQPARAEDVPAAFMRAYAVALQPPAGPVFLSIPLDDWNKPALGPAVVRTVSYRVAPDEVRLFVFAERLNKAKRPMLVFGPPSFPGRRSKSDRFKQTVRRTRDRCQHDPVSQPRTRLNHDPRLPAWQPDSNPQGRVKPRGWPVT